MKVLLIGFSRQSANVLEMYMRRNYPSHTPVVIERSFGDNLRLSLPKLSKSDVEAQAMIINLDGVGMISHSKEYAKELQAFIGVRAALMVARGGLSLWQSAKILPDDFIFFLKSPFDKNAMTHAVEALLAAAKLADSRQDEFACRDPMITKFTHDSPTTASTNSSDTNLQTITKIHKEHFLHKLIDRYFELPNQALLHEMLDVSLIDMPVKMTAGSQTLYLNKQKNMALVNNIERLIDYCVVANNCQILSNVLSFETVSEDEFLALAVSNDYKKYPLNNLLWQIQSALLPGRIVVKDHYLLLKMRYMPNFAYMKDVPEYVRTIASASLVAPRSINQLGEITGLGQNGKMLINRVLLLAILSNAADEEILRHGFEVSFDEPKQQINNQPANLKNAGIKKALGSGFLRRLIEKLNTPISEL